MILNVGEVWNRYHIDRLVPSRYPCPYREAYEAHYVEEEAIGTSPLLDSRGSVFVVVYRADLMPRVMKSDERFHEFDLCQRLAGRTFMQVLDFLMKRALYILAIGRGQYRRRMCGV